MENMPNRAAATGLWGEQLALALLAACGYRCLDRRYRCTRGELDLVVQRHEVVAFVEVKTRAGNGVDLPECFVDRTKLRRMRAAAASWLGEHPDARGRTLRFDVVGIVHHGQGQGVDIRHLAGIG